jgi:hypothetical protein
MYHPMAVTIVTIVGKTALFAPNAEKSHAHRSKWKDLISAPNAMPNSSDAASAIVPS